MRKLKITRTISYENEEPQDSIPEFESLNELIAYAEKLFEERTGLKEGAKVRYVGVNDAQLDYWRGIYSDPRNILTSEAIYEIEYIEIHRSFTIVKLVGFREEEFNGIIFRAVDKSEPKKSLKIGDVVRYIGKNNKHSDYGCSNASDFLDYEGVYEVKSFEKHSGYYAQKVVR